MASHTSDFPSRSLACNLFSLLLFVLVFILCRPALAGDGGVRGQIDCERFKGYCHISDLAIIGLIDSSTADRLTEIFAEISRKADAKKQPEGFAHTRIALDSPGGSVTAAMAIGRLLRKYRMTVEIPPSARCNSACVLVYAGAVIRLGHFHAGEIGIHRPFLDVPAKPIDAEAAKNMYLGFLGEMRKYLREMNVSEQLADEMLKTPSTSIRYLTHEEQDHFGLVIFDPVEIEIGNLEHAQALGVDRSEYNRREALILSRCPLDADYGRCHDTVYKTGKLPVPLDFSSQGIPVSSQLRAPKQKR